jgi:hypothetical protein
VSGATSCEDCRDTLIEDVNETAMCAVQGKTPRRGSWRSRRHAAGVRRQAPERPQQRRAPTRERVAAVAGCRWSLAGAARGS